jgi:transposase
MSKRTILTRPVDRADFRERLQSVSNRRLRERLQSILWVDEGMEAKDAATKIGRCRQSVASFVELFNKGGIERLLKIGRGPGRKSKLEKKHRGQLLRWILQGPRRFNLPFSNWDCPRLVYQIKRQWNIILSDEQVRRILHQEGYVLARPKHKLPERDLKLHSKKNGKFRSIWLAPKIMANA